MNEVKSFDQDQAYTEGWCVSECVGSSYFPDGWMEIQRVDEVGIFDSDFEALKFVVSNIIDGSTYHANAYYYMEQHNFKMVKR